MAVEIITKQDLAQFKTELLGDIKEIINSGETTQAPRKWLKSYEVKKMLGISPGTLQNLRINGTLSYTRLVPPGAAIMFCGTNTGRLAVSVPATRSITVVNGAYSVVPSLPLILKSKP